MDNERLICELKEICKSPEPERKKEFFESLREQGMTNRHPVVMSHVEFLLNQFFYIPKWIWMLSLLILLFITSRCYQTPERCPFALTPLLAAGILVETRRSFRWKMAELEHAARYSLKSVVFTRLFLVGTVDTIGLLAVICAIQSVLSYSLIQVFLYMMVPYLAASLSGSVYERKHRTDNNLGSIMICIMSSGFFAVAPFLYSELYEERMTIIWGVAFVLLFCSLIVTIRRWIFEMEEPAWSF